MPIHAELSLAAPNAAPLGLERVRLLEAIGREGSISGAARAVGLSYRAAWDAIGAMNGLTGHPLVTAKTGGARGGGARLTIEGVALVEMFHRVQTEMAHSLQSLAPDLAGKREIASPRGFVGFRSTSARNMLRGYIALVTQDGVNAEVGLEVADAGTLTVSLTRHSMNELRLVPGSPATALVKAPLIRLVQTVPDMKFHNRLDGIIEHVETGLCSTEILLAIGGGNTLCAVVAHPEAPSPGFTPGDRATAVIDPAHIILAVE